MTDTTVRSYSVLLSTRNNHKLTGLLEDTFKLYIRGGDVFANFFLNLFGALDPAFLKQSPLSTCKVLLPEFENDEYKLISRPITDQMLLFSSWFSLESQDHAPKEYVCEPDAIWQQFVGYCDEAGATGLDKSLESLIAHNIQSIKTDEECKKAWVDRRRLFFDLNQKLQIPQAALRWWFTDPNFPFQANKIEAPKATRIFLSKWFGKGVKNDWLSTIARIKQLDLILSQCGTEPEFVERSGKYLRGVKVGTLGAPSTLQKMIDGTYSDYTIKNRPMTEPEKIEKIRSTIGMKLSEAQHHDSFPEGDWQDKVLRHLEEKIGVNFKHGKNRIAQFGEMSNIALERLKSWKSNFFRQVGERILLLNQPSLPDTPEHALMCQWLVDYMNTFSEFRKKTPFIADKAFNGLAEVCRHWEKTPPEQWKEAVKAAQNSDTNRFGNANMFMYLAERCSRLPQVNWLQVIKDCKVHLFTQYKLRTMRSPHFRHVSLDAANYPNFEKKVKSAQANRPEYNMEVVTSPKRCPTDPHLLSIELYNGEDFMPVEIPFVGKRFMQEIALRAPNEEGVDAPRRHRLMAEMMGVKLEDLNPTALIKGAKLIRNGYWFGTDTPRYCLNISVEMGLSSPSEKDFVNPAIGTRYLAVDLGVRDVAAYAVWEIVTSINHPGPFLKNEKGFYRRIEGAGKVIWVKLVGNGSIHDMQLPDEESKRMDRFDRSLDSPLDQKEIELWKRLGSAGVFDNKRMPEKLCQFNNDIVFYLGHFVRRCVRGVKEVLGNIGKERLKAAVSGELEKRKQFVADVYNQIFSKRDGERRRQAGGMSYKRIETFMNLKSICQTYVDWIEDKEVTEWINVLDKKINNLRTERARVTTSRIISAAISHNVDVVCAENLTLATSHSFGKRMNRMISRWCPKKIIQQLEMQCPLHGLLLTLVNPAGTSMTDFATDKWSPRLTRLYLGELTEDKRWGNFINYYKTSNNSEGSDKFEVYKRAWLELVKTLGLKSLDEIIPYAKENRDERHWIPSHSGESILSASASHGIDADQNAARNIGLRGIFNLAKMYEGSSARKPKRHQNRPKAVTRKK